MDVLSASEEKCIELAELLCQEMYLGGRTRREKRTDDVTASDRHTSTQLQASLKAVFMPMKSTVRLYLGINYTVCTSTFLNGSVDYTYCVQTCRHVIILLVYDSIAISEALQNTLGYEITVCIRRCEFSPLSTYHRNCLTLPKPCN